MRLTKIKLAGFKSFVDPTVFYVPSNLVGVVGPNGCGKSNIIDAVRWVMGESSARHLRGESMADVIFNGSAARKPVGQASIELFFDNSLGKLTGPWAHYTEIAVRRLVDRTAQSTYFLNGARCRRRDITDIFLGTGLGPRSYAIIEQGTISRIVEAKPEDLRFFFEEAAGVSKYKDRRRETETRIRQTRENLERLTDVRTELDKQLTHLQKQAHAAEQYKNFKTEEQRLKAELIALRWQALDSDITARERTLQEQETALAGEAAAQSRLDAELAAGRETLATLHETRNQAQERCYETGTEIARLEQQLAHRRELRQRRHEELRQIEQALVEMQNQLQIDRAQVTELTQSLAEAEPALAAAEAEQAAAESALAEAEAALQSGQTAWESVNQQVHEAQRQADVERTRIEQLERQTLQQERRLERLRLEQDSLADSALEQDLEAAHTAAQEAETLLAQGKAELHAVEARLAQWRETQRQINQELHELQTRVQTTHGRLGSLAALQEQALGTHQATLADWLEQSGLHQAPCLAERLTVEPGWERAVEMALGKHLEALCVPALEPLAGALTELARGELALFETADTTPAVPLPGLAEKIQAPWTLDGVLAEIHTAADLAEALSRRHELQSGQSLMTPDGIWVGRRWLRVLRETDDGVLAREQELRRLRQTLARDEERIALHSEMLERLRTQLQTGEQSRGALQDEIQQSQQDLARWQREAHTLRTRLEQNRIRRDAIAAEQAEWRQQAQEDRERLQEARMQLEEALAAMEKFDAERENLSARRDSLRQTLQSRRQQAAAARQTVQQQALAIGAWRSSLAAVQQALARLETQQQQATARREQLQQELADADEPNALDGEQLETLLTLRAQADDALRTARQEVNAQEAVLRELDKNYGEHERQLQAQRQALESQRLALSEANVRRQTLLDQLQELDAVLAEVLAQLPAEAEEIAWRERLDKLAGRIQRLGPINLAAIDEYAQLSERKQYLDAQDADLVEALTTLENAIRKIDRDTRSLFKDTFDRVNAGLQELFPRLFGGGQAYLELIGDDALNAGVAIMAKPPGKRIGNIHLLSGGEKALTAVALVFAIFQLNPAPFCLLDEVDAPLDEANVGRFGALVREMSAQVQFIFVTHNKATMEIARHLSGVTMNEPGVSRLVAVDVDEAVRLTAVS